MSAKLRDDLRLHGAEADFDHYDEGALQHQVTSPLEGLTHIISSTFNFPDYDAALDAFIPVIRPTWVNSSIVRSKLAPPRQYNPNPRQFMSDVVVCCADIPDGDQDAICGGVLAMGGGFTSKISTQVTHLVALTMENEKCGVVQAKNLNIKIVLPHWFDDCLKLGRRIDEQPYLLPDPEYGRQLQRPPKATDNSHIKGASNPHPSMNPEPTPPAGRNGFTVFKNKSVMLAKNLGIGSHLRDILEDLIEAGQGKVATSVQKANVYICKYREGNDFKRASRSGKDVGNLAWLYDLITNNTWTSPLRRLLHYPVAREGLKGFSGLRISISNYSGEARSYLEQLVTATGAEYTKTMKQDNTHLITAHSQSEKVSAAKDWGINVINHLWLEESYAEWKMQSLTNSRYTHFPDRTNLQEVVGKIRVNRAAVEKNFFADDDVYMDEPEESPEPMHARDLNVPSRIAPPAKTAPTKIVKQTEKPYTPAASRFVALGKENETPGTTGSRKTKDAALAKLHEMSPDIALYEKERKRVGGVVYGGRRKGDEDRIEMGRKRSVDEASDSEPTEENEPKRPKRGALPPPVMQLLISGYKKWVGAPKIEDSDKKQLRSLGIIVTLDPARASHLAAPKILRTHKFVTALAYAPVVLSTDYIDACLERAECLVPEKFLLKDPDNEKKLGVSLTLSHSRAIENRKQLLRGRTIYCVENIHGDFEVFKSIIEANGGQCLQYRGRPTNLIPSTRAGSETSGTEDSVQNEVYLLSGAGPQHKKYWSKFRAMAEHSRKSPRIVTAEWLLETAMCQSIQAIANYELRD
jgi:Regulator of Ty1 transposition protein 107 BRCT domain/twin BRCT domain